MCKVESSLQEIDIALMNATDNNQIERLMLQQINFKNQVEVAYAAKDRGCHIRVRAKWVEEGEKNSKYFLGLEKKRQTNNIITTVKNKSGHNVYKKEEIIKEVVQFYENLYSPSEIHENNIDNFLNELDVRYVLTNAEGDSCEGHVTEEECTYVMQ